MALHPCPRCKTLIPVGVQYCAACRPLADAQAQEAMERKRAHKSKQYAKQYNARRDPKYLTFYRSKDWRLLSRTYLQRAGYKCQAKLEGCKGLAVEVHHIKPIQAPDGWDLRLDWDNLEAVCTSCHNARHGGQWKKQKQDGVIDMREIARKE